MPKSFARFMYPNGKIEGDSLVMIMDNREYVSERRTGLYDDGILCSACDEWLGQKYDQYGKEVLIDTEPEFVKEVDLGGILAFPNINAGRLKLFILSVLWRFSVSSLPELALSKLPDNFQETLRNMILAEDPGNIDSFSILISRFYYEKEGEDKGLNKYFQIPINTRMADGINYKILYFPNGYKVYVKIDRRPQPAEFIPLSLENGKPAYVVKYEEFEKTLEFQALLNNASKVKKR